MHALDEVYTATPFYGSRRLQAALRCEGWTVNRKRVQRLMRLMGIEAVGPKPRLSQAHPSHRLYPYLLRGSILDWFSRYVLAWELSVTLDGQFCRDALERPLASGRPEVFNNDQGAQFTSDAFTSLLRAAEVQISMDGRGRALDNVFVERLWPSVKYEEVYLKDYLSVPEVRAGGPHRSGTLLRVLQSRTAAPGAGVRRRAAGILMGAWTCGNLADETPTRPHPAHRCTAGGPSVRTTSSTGWRTAVRATEGCRLQPARGFSGFESDRMSAISTLRRQRTTVGSQSSSNFAFAGLPIRWSTSAGRRKAGSMRTCSCQSLSSFRAHNNLYDPSRCIRAGGVCGSRRMS